jgi:hypothetical protein
MVSGLAVAPAQAGTSRAPKRNFASRVEPPAIYLARLKKRLEAIAAGNIGGTAPILSNWIQDLEDVWLR